MLGKAQEKPEKRGKQQFQVLIEIVSRKVNNGLKISILKIA